MNRNAAIAKAQLGILLTLALQTSAVQAGAAYESPYGLTFTQPFEQLTEPDNREPRNDARQESYTPYDRWYSQHVLRKFGSWGPEPRHYPPVVDLTSTPAQWQRERVLSVARRLIGLPYQHHHIPDWDPPRNWPWKPVAYGRQSKGLDCSDFTSWCYNYGLGIKLKTGIRQQAETVEIPGPGGQGLLRVMTILAGIGYDDLVQKLKTGDLLYIKNKHGAISHVIMWVGDIGRSPDGVPLVIDCTGPEHKDSNGITIPTGVYLRPFRRNSWYFESLAHAHRIIQ